MEKIHPLIKELMKTAGIKKVDQSITKTQWQKFTKSLSAEIRSLHASNLLQHQAKILEFIAKGDPIKTILEMIVNLFEESDDQGLRVAILIYEEKEKKLKFGAAPRLPKRLFAGIGNTRLVGDPLKALACLESGENKWVDKIGARKTVTKVEEDLQKLKVVNTWAFPVHTGERPAGVVLIFSPVEGRPTTEQKEIVEICTNLTGIAIDRTVSEQIIADQQLQLVLSSKMMALAEMAGGIAHEINNPLAIIQGRATQIRDLVTSGKFKTEDIDYFAKKIEMTAMRISKIIKGLRAFARDGTEDPFEDVTVDSIVDETFEFCKERFKSHGIELTVSGLGEKVILECRPVQVSQVLLNLLNNAYDAVQNFPIRWVRLGVADLGEEIEFTITDSGEGVPDEVQARIMQPFFTTKEIGKGTGLGLSISKGIVESHHGRLTIDLNQGNTCFKVTLPKKQPKEDEIDSVLSANGSRVA